MKLKFITGSGFTIRTTGNFVIKTEKNEIHFTNFFIAESYFNSLKEPKSFWDITDKPELCAHYEYK